MTFKQQLQKAIEAGKIYNLNKNNEFVLKDFKSNISVKSLIEFLKEENNFEQLKQLINEH